MRRLTRRQRLAAAVLTVLALIFISIDFTGGSLGGARGHTTGAMGALYNGTDAVLGPVRRFIQGVPDVGSNRSRIAQLQADNDRLRRQLSESQVDAATETQLKALQLQASSANLPILPARVIATGPGAGAQWTVTVDVGSAEQVLVGQTVTNGVGLVGRVLTVQRNSSVILLESDPDAAVGVRDSTTGSLFLAKGAGVHGLRATSLASGATAKVGDAMLTGPATDTTFVANLMVATVTSVSSGADGVLSLQLKAAAAQTDLNLLGIIAVPVSGVIRAPLNPATG
jgi:rod shape-determining protein MreC